MIKDVKYAGTNHRMFWVWISNKEKYGTEILYIIYNVNFVCCIMKPILEKLLAITFMVLKQEWITILSKVEVGYQRENSPFMSLIAFDEIIDNWKNHFLYTRHALLKK